METRLRESRGRSRSPRREPARRVRDSITLGLTVTRPNPEPMILKGLRITQQRVVLPLELSIRKGRPVFRPMIGTDRGDLYGNTLYLASRDRNGFVAHEDVIAAVLRPGYASSRVCRLGG